MATCPVDKGAVNAGPFPPELTVSMGDDNAPRWPISKDCSAPASFSFTALQVSFQGHLAIRHGVLRKVKEETY